MAERDLISGEPNPSEVGRHMGRWCVLPREAPPDMMTKGCHRHYKTKPIRRTRSGEGSEGGRSTGSTNDSGPMKPGNPARRERINLDDQKES